MSNSNHRVSMKRMTTALIAGMLAITSAMPGSATVSDTIGQNLTSEQQSTQLLATKKKGESSKGDKKPEQGESSKKQENKWHVNQEGVNKKDFEKLNESEQEKFNQFKNAIAEGLHPREAAKRAGDTKYTKLQGTDNQYEIRLSQGARVTFLVDDEKREVKILQVGGHT